MSDSGNQRIYREYGCDYCKQIKASVRVRPGGANLCRECWLEPDKEQPE